jgi:hypothetical protein
MSSMKMVSTRECSPSESIETSDTEPGSPAMEFRQRRNGSDASFKVKLQMIPFEIGLTNSNNSFVFICGESSRRRARNRIRCRLPTTTPAPSNSEVRGLTRPLRHWRTLLPLSPPFCLRHSADGRHPPATPTPT